MTLLLIKIAVFATLLSAVALESTETSEHVEDSIKTNGETAGISIGNVTISVQQGNWIPYTAGMTLLNPVKGGQIYNNEITNICRANFSDGSVKVGKHAWDTCYFPEENFEKAGFEVLVNKENQAEPQWFKLENNSLLPSEPISGGFRADDHSQLLICRFSIQSRIKYCDDRNGLCCELCRKPKIKDANSDYEYSGYDGHYYNRPTGVLVNGYYEPDIGICNVEWGNCAYRSLTDDTTLEILGTSNSTITFSSLKINLPTVYFEPIATFSSLNTNKLLSILEGFNKSWNNLQNDDAASEIPPENKSSGPPFEDLIEYLTGHNIKFRADSLTSLYHFETQNIEGRLEFTDLNAKLVSIVERLERILNLNLSLSKDDVRLEIVPAIELMDELYVKMNDDAFVIWGDPLVSAPYFLIYAQLHKMLCEVAPQIIPSYQQQCLEKLKKISRLVIKFTRVFIEKRVEGVTDNLEPMSSDIYQTWFVDLGYCYAKDTHCGSRRFKIVDDPIDIEFRELNNPGFYTYRNYDGVEDYTRHLIEVYFNLFLRYIDIEHLTKDKNSDATNKSTSEARSEDSNCNFDFPLSRESNNCGDDLDTISKIDCETKGCCYDPMYKGQVEGQTIYQCFNK